MDPAFPSMPPPPEDETIKPMSVIGAAMWATGAEILFLWIVTATRALKGEDGYDMIGALMCQVAAFLFVLYLVLRVHAPQTPIRSLIALRKTNPWFYLLAPILGASAAYPSYALLELIHRIRPPEEELYDWLDVFFTLSEPERIAVAIGTVAIGPFMEEMLFRGALYRPMRIDKKPATVIAVTAFLFAAAHLDMHKLVPLFLMGLMLGYVRWASGSLVPPLLLHMTYNAIPIIQIMGYDQKPPDEGEPLPISLVAGGAGLLVLALLFTQALARSSRRASAARRDDK
jgi:membrane protease YdiL (CAAX protease family)